MIETLLHIGGHADGRWVDVEMTVVDGHFMLPPVHELNERETVDIPIRDYTTDFIADAISVTNHSTVYIRESIVTNTGNGRVEAFIYVAQELGKNWVPHLMAGYRVPEPCPLCGEMPADGPE